MKRIAMYFTVAMVFALLLCPTTTEASSWYFHKTVPTPGGTTSIIRMAADSTGKVYLSDGPAGAKVIYSSTDILTAANPTYTPLVSKTTTPNNNGMQGIAFDGDDNVYISWDWDGSNPGWVRKYSSAGNLIWEVTPSIRPMGLAVMSNGTVITTSNVGRLLAFDPVSGAQIAEATLTPQPHLRGITVVPDPVGGEDVIYGVVSGTLYKYTGGSVSNIPGYATGTLVSAKADTTWQVRPCVQYSPIDNTLIWSNMLENRFFVLDADTDEQIQVLNARSVTENYVTTGAMTVVDGNDGYLYLITSSSWGNLSIYRKPATPVASVKEYVVGPVASATPVIDGVVSAGEWGDGSPHLSGFVRHDNNTVAAVEDQMVKAVYDDDYLYVLIQTYNSNFSLDFNPTGGGRDPSGTGFAGDDWELFFYPAGNSSPIGYQIVFFPNQVDNICYIWDTAGTLTSYPGSAAWNATGDQAAFSYDDNTKLLTIEYRIPWTAFNLPGALVTGPPADGAQWGVQIGHINNNPAETVNWEPSGTAGFVQGPPWGTWTFTTTPTSVDDWVNY